MVWEISNWYLQKKQAYEPVVKIIKTPE